MGLFDKFLKKENAATNQISYLANRIIEQLSYPYKVFGAGTSYDFVMKAYEESKERGKEKGFTPVLVPVDVTLEDHFGILKEEGFSKEALLEKEIDAAEGKHFLMKRFEEYIDDYREDFEMSIEDFIGVYEDEPDCINHYSSFVDYKTHQVVETILFEVSTKNPWELVAYVPFGGWNECPEVEQMLAVCK